ncbi:MAG: hypothetical protein JSV80_11330 [Acidobacteriota bacterium]|nr:MAG: hypothetical protein JSV80_11330 [Acidobacteriota bacterium]
MRHAVGDTRHGIVANNGRPLWVSVSHVLVCLSLASVTSALAVQNQQERIVLLPVLDRTGDPSATATLSYALRHQLIRHHDVAASSKIRDLLRARRLRDIRAIPPQVLEELAEELDAEWFMTAALLEASPGPPPIATVSAQVIEKGKSTLAWAGFESATGVDDKRWLGLGGVEDLEQLLLELARRLITDFESRVGAGRTEARAADDVYLRRPLSTSELGVVAVIPFDSVAEVEATVGADAVTELAQAVLFREGFELAYSGTVHDILIRRGEFDRGEMDDVTRSAVRSVAGADSFFTGTVESYFFRRSSPEPEPEVAFHARILEATEGQILWIGGLEQAGWDQRGLFGLGRVFARGRLAENMMHSLVASFANERRRARRGSP